LDLALPCVVSQLDGLFADRRLGLKERFGTQVEGLHILLFGFSFSEEM
jgi:hypothetical protein